MKGYLSYFGFVELLQAVVPEKSGIIAVTSRGKEGYVHFSKGELFHAEIIAGNTAITGEEALFSISLWLDGMFSVITKKTTPEMTTLPRSFRSYLMQLSSFLIDYNAFAALCTHPGKKVHVRYPENSSFTAKETAFLVTATACKTYTELVDKANLWQYTPFLLAASLYVKGILGEKDERGERTFFALESILHKHNDKTVVYEILINEFFGKIIMHGTIPEVYFQERLHELSRTYPGLSAYDINGYTLKLFDEALKSKQALKKIEHGLEIFLYDIINYCDTNHLFPGYIHYIWHILVRRCGYFWIQRSREKMAAL